MNSLDKGEGGYLEVRDRSHFRKLEHASKLKIFLKEGALLRC